MGQVKSGINPKRNRFATKDYGSYSGCKWGANKVHEQWLLVLNLSEFLQYVKINFEIIKPPKYAEFSVFLLEKTNFEIGCKLSATQNDNALILPTKSFFRI